MKKRFLSLAMALCMVLSLLPAAAFADENAETPVCTCEEACTAEDMDAECAVCGAEGAAIENCCKYAEAIKEESAEAATQSEAAESEESGSESTGSETADSETVESEGADPEAAESEAAVCNCENSCMAEAMNTECPVCGAEGAAVEDCCKYVAPEQDGSTEATTPPEAPVCACEEACTADAMDAECPVCGAEGAVVENCGKYIAPVVEEQVEEVVQQGVPAGEEPELTAVEKVQAMINALPTVEDLENADEETVDEVYAALQDVCDAMDELSTEELDQLTGLDKLAALMEWFTGSVSTYDEGDFNYTLEKTTGTITITKYTGSDVSVVIPDKIDGKTVTAIGASAFANCTSLESVTIPSSVTSIGEAAFNFCRSLKSIEIPNSVTSIGNRAFTRCYRLASISLPDSVTSIGEAAFNYCYDLKSIIIPNGVKSIGDSVFQQCDSLTSVTLPDSVTSIGDSAFRYCPELKSINIPNSVKSIGAYAFEDCSSLENITIPDGVTSIGDSAFYSCDGLTSITIPGSVTLGNAVFLSCDSLTSVNIQNGIISIPMGTFSYCKNLKSIEIPSSVTSVGEGAFYYCQSLESIFLPEGLVVASASIPNTTSQVRYRLDTSKGEVTITGIDLGTYKSGVAIPATICGYPVVAAEDGLLERIISHTCAGGEATCQTKAVCGICKQEYGEKNPDKHTGTKVWKTTETQHRQYWDCCDAVVVNDQDHTWNNGVCSVCGYTCAHRDVSPKDHACDICGASLSRHTGGEATCISKAICDYCKEEYGEFDSTNHDLEHHDGKEPDCTEIGWNAYDTCKRDGCSYTTYQEIPALGHDLEHVPAKESTVTETGNREYWQCQDCGDIFSDPDGKNKMEPEDTVTAKLPPEITKGAGQSITAGEKKALSFTSNAAFRDFIRVELDGKTLDDKNYTAKEGSTVVTLDVDYVSTLLAGEHTIGIVSESGTASTTFTVNAKAERTDSTQAGTNNTNTPQTGDNSPIAWWIALLFASGCLLTVTGIYGKKKKYNR